MDNRLRQLDGQRTSPKIGADNSEANQKTGQTKSDVDRVRGMSVSLRIGVTDDASGPLSGTRSLLGSLHDKTIRVTTVHRTVRQNAAGGYYPAVGEARRQMIALATGGLLAADYRHEAMTAYNARVGASARHGRPRADQARRERGPTSRRGSGKRLHAA